VLIDRFCDVLQMGKVISKKEFYDVSCFGNEVRRSLQQGMFRMAPATWALSNFGIKQAAAAVPLFDEWREAMLRPLSEAQICRYVADLLQPLLSDAPQNLPEVRFDLEPPATDM
jgi:hypothetical protein